MRNIQDVINQIRSHVPTEQGPLLQDLRNISSSAAYRAPEIMYVDWQSLEESLCIAVGNLPTEDWHFEVLSILSTVPVNEIRRDVVGMKSN